MRFERFFSTFCLVALYVYVIVFADHNPAAQGSSLTEGKRAKRSKKHSDVNGDNGSASPQNGEDEVDCEIEAPEKKKANEDVRLHSYVLTIDKFQFRFCKSVCGKQCCIMQHYFL